MSQELLFLLFLFFEGMLIIVLYQFYLVPRIISPMVVQHWLDEIESGRINLPKVLESYTGELLGQVDALFFGYTNEEGKKLKVEFRNFMKELRAARQKPSAARKRDSAPPPKRVKQRTLVCSGNRTKTFTYIAASRRPELNPLRTCFTQLSTRINQEITS